MKKGRLLQNENINKAIQVSKAGRIMNFSILHRTGADDL